VPCIGLQYAFEYLENKFILVTNDKILWFDREACLSAFAIEITAEISLPGHSLILDIKSVSEFKKYPFLIIREAKQIYFLNTNNGQLR